MHLREGVFVWLIDSFFFVVVGRFGGWGLQCLFYRVVVGCIFKFEAMCIANLFNSNRRGCLYEVLFINWKVLLTFTKFVLNVFLFI